MSVPVRANGSFSGGHAEREARVVSDNPVGFPPCPACQIQAFIETVRSEVAERLADRIVRQRGKPQAFGFPLEAQIAIKVAGDQLPLAGGVCRRNRPVRLPQQPADDLQLPDGYGVIPETVLRPCLADGESGRKGEGEHLPCERPFHTGKWGNRGQQVAERSCDGVSVSNEIPVFYLVRAQYAGQSFSHDGLFTNHNFHFLHFYCQVIICCLWIILFLDLSSISRFPWRVSLRSVVSLSS